jgi:hypothetical protein
MSTRRASWLTPLNLAKAHRPQSGVDSGENTDRYVVQATHLQTGEAIDERCANIRDAVNRAAELIRADYAVVITSITRD